ncbi:GntR family transcriptional regulator [Actinomadura physcomitrii]|nr:GntR family transcriptional regulator [Actinomadura physcomitrii]
MSRSIHRLPPGDSPADGADASESSTPRLVDQIVERLQQMIISGEIKPGTPLRQMEVAEQLGVSRTPLREALRILTNMGLLTTEKFKRTLEVADLLPQDLEDVLEMRDRLDPIAARSAARHGLDASVVDELKAHLEVMTCDQDELDPRAYIESHVAFHMLITEHCRSPLLVRMAPLLKLGGNMVRGGVTNKVMGNGAARQRSRAAAMREFNIVRRHHRDLFEAIMSRDPVRAEEVAEHHVLISGGPGGAVPLLMVRELESDQ